jgi:hypothetical protein
MQPIVRGHNATAVSPAFMNAEELVHTPARHMRSADQTLELCLLETQRQVMRLEEIVHRLTSVAGTGGAPPTGVMSLLREGNRRLQREVDEFAYDAHAVLNIVVKPTVPFSLVR